MVCTDEKSTGLGIVSCDWFSLSCHLTRPWLECVICPPAGVSVVKLTPTKVWSERWYLIDADGNKVATILAVPRSWKIASDRVVVEISNRWLYMSDFYTVLDGVLECLPLVVDGLNRIDLCCDFEMSESKYEVWKMLSSGNAYVGAYKSGFNSWHEAERQQVFHQLSWGGKDSLLHWKVYWKWKELQDADEDGKKPYIVDTWRNYGFSVEDVWRCEVSIAGSRNFISLETGRHILAREWYERRVELWKSFYSSRFVVRKREGHADKRNDEVLEFLDVSGEKIVRTAVPVSVARESDPERRLLSKLWDEYCSVDVQANVPLYRMVASNLWELCERPANAMVLSRMAGMSIDEVAKSLMDAMNSPLVGTTK